ncbi:MAG: hypothetical protein R2724_35150 [Bryobacterales bacterium]
MGRSHSHLIARVLLQVGMPMADTVIRMPSAVRFPVVPSLGCVVQ